MKPIRNERKFLALVLFVLLILILCWPVRAKETDSKVMCVPHHAKCAYTGRTVESKGITYFRFSCSCGDTLYLESTEGMWQGTR